jgi:hypothetical protein
VLIANDAHRKHITSIEAVRLPFVTYLLTIPRNKLHNYLNIVKQQIEKNVTNIYNKHFYPTPQICQYIDLERTGLHQTRLDFSGL